MMLFAYSPSTVSLLQSLGVAAAIVVVAVVVAVGLFLWLDDNADMVPISGGIIVGGLVVAVVMFFVMMGVTGHGEKFKRERGRGDAPRTAQEHIDTRPADWVVNFPDGFGNIASKCIDTGLRGYITSKANGASDLETRIDPTCDDYRP
jgi:hypothetical protein